MRNRSIGACLMLLATAALPATPPSSKPLAAAPVGQEGRLKGTVTDTEGNHLAAVTLILHAPDKGIRFEFTTDDEGTFYRRGIRPGNYVLVCQKEGYDTVEHPITVRFEDNNIDIVMQSSAIVEARARSAAANDAYAAGYEAFRSGEFAEAIGAIEQVITNITDVEGSREVMVSALTILGRSHLELQHYPEAAAAYERLLEIAPDDAGAHLDLGEAYAQQNEYEKAAEQFQRALELQPDDPHAHYNVGVLLLQAGQVEEGIATLEKCLELQPEYPLAHKSLGYGYARAGDYPKAIEHFEAYLKQMPDATDAEEIKQFIAALRQ